MKLQFSSNQEYQNIAVKSVIDIFEGQPLARGDFEISFSSDGTSLNYSEKGVGNKLYLDEEQLLKNIQFIQSSNGIDISDKLINSISEDGKTRYTCLNFTIEMETGTGKTYTFLRTIYELNKVYGFKKFVIVVPSVAIREGTIKNLEITHDHFQDLYGAPNINYTMYDSRKLTELRNFAISNAIQILVINIDSFTKDTNIINTQRETGVKPIEYIQATNPIVIIDEPQNFETDTRRLAVHNLHPMCTLRYSATHRNIYNLVYSLNPVQAYDLGLVKQIEVDGISTSSSNQNEAYIKLKKIVAGKRIIKAKVSLYVNDKHGVKSKDLLLNLGDDLYELSNHRDTYKSGFVLTSINAKEGIIEFANGVNIREGELQGGLSDEIMKFQIERCIRHHFEKLKKLKNKKIKILSLFFVDKVANYRSYDEDENPTKGKFALWFEEAFMNFKNQPLYKDLIPYEVEKVHNGYFSIDKIIKGKEKKEFWRDSKEKNTQKDEDTYNLIMRDKEKLLSIDEPLQFIFSHSALREGWDNPNVFQICTLNETKSDLKKRQEIGRGLRLPVNHDGFRIQDKNINVLTVIANETYEDFSETLQREIRDETGVEFKDRIQNARDKAQISFSKELTIENYPLLFEIWEKISKQTRYSVNYKTEELISRTVNELKDFNKVPLTRGPLLESKTASIKMTNEGIEGILQNTSIKKVESLKYQIPDVYSYIQNKIKITRNTIYEILIQSQRYEELEINPQLFLDNVVAAIQRTLNNLLVDGISYQENEGKYYEMELFNFEEIETYLSKLFLVTKTEKTVFNYIPTDSEVEKDFAKACEANENIKFYFKLPKNFKISTPIGAYNPDWAIVFQNESKIYFVAETKGTLDRQLLKEIEKMKIECGTKHFALFKPLGVEYRLAVKADDLYK